MTMVEGNCGWSDYRAMVDAFADKVCDLYQPGDVVMVHDYHLMMLPHILRRRLPGMYLIFSLHAACPPYGLSNTRLRPLSKVLAGALGSDIISFQAPIHFERFKSWCAKESREWTPYWTSQAAKACVVYPMGIDASRVRSIAWNEAATNTCGFLRSSFKGKKIIVSYSTLDFSQEMAHVIKGFDRLETLFPRWRERAVLLQITNLPCLSRDEGAPGLCINLVHTLTTQSNCSAPRKSFRGRLSESEYYALLRASDTIIFPFAPGNLMTAGLDYVLCQPGGNKRPIISDVNPLKYHLPAAITFPPWDIDSIARAFNYALEYSDQPPMALHQGFDPFMVNTAENWMNSVLHALVDRLIQRRFLHKRPTYMRPGSWCIPVAMDRDDEDEERDDGIEGTGKVGNGGDDSGGDDNWSGGERKKDSEEDTETETEDEDDEENAAATRLRARSMLVESTRGKVDRCVRATTV